MQDSYESHEETMYAEARVGGARRMRIVLVEDHAILREGLKALLEMEPAMQVVGEADNVSDGLAAIESLEPSVVITDIGLPDRSGIDLIAALRARNCSSPILVLTVLHSEEKLRAAMHAGASGFVLKDSPLAELIEGLHAVASGKKFLCETLSNEIFGGLGNDMSRDHDRTKVRLITHREREVLTRIALGQSNKGVARALGLSVKTVEKHRSNLMRKLNLHNSAAVTMFALRHGLVKGEETRVG
jgi:two-component system, NarL family, response regulator NreC